MGLPTPSAGDEDTPPRPFPLTPFAVLLLAVVATAGYVNLSYSVTRPENLRFFPPYLPYFDRNMNTHLGAEYYSIAKALYAGRGFSDPFREASGPTAWMPPVFPACLAAILWMSGGDEDAVVNAMIIAQAAAVVIGGLSVLLLARRTAPGTNPWTVLGVYAAFVLGHFTLAFQQTHDSWLVLLALTAVLAGSCSGRMLRSVARAAGWGLFGGFAALINPVVGFVWGVLVLAEAVRSRAIVRLFVASLAAVLMLTPWTVRNYQTFGRLIPIKSNLGYELYQSHCLEPDGLLRLKQFTTFHPYNAPNPESRKYRQLGEVAYIDEKTAAFRAAVLANPGDYAAKVGNRFVAATLVYVPTNAEGEDQAYWGLWISRILHPLPFLSALCLIVTAPRFGLRREQATVLLAYAAYLLPYILASYYERYSFPLLAAQTILVVWAIERLSEVVKWRRRPPTLVAGPPPVSSATQGWPWHRWAIGLFVSAGLWWWYGAEFAERLYGPVYERSGNTVVVPDFFQEWYSARLWWDGQPPYTPVAAGAHHQHLNLPAEVCGHFFQWNAHPPGAVLVALPLGALDFPVALRIWNVLSLCAFTVACVLVVRRLGCPVPDWLVPPTVAALLLSNPFWTQVTHGQLNLLLLLLFTAGWALDRSDRPTLAGSVIGVAATIKLFPAYLLVYFVLSGRWKGFVAGLLTIAAVLVLSSAVLGWDVWVVYCTQIVPHTKEFSTIWVNASLIGFWLKLFDPAMPWIGFHPWPIIQSRGVAMAAGLLTVIGLTGLLRWCIRSGQLASDPDARFAAVVVVSLLLSPTTWDHYFLLLLLPVVVLMRSPLSGWPRFGLWVALVALSGSAYQWGEIGMLLAGVSPDWSKGGWESPPWLTATILSVHTHALLGLLGLLLFGPRRLPTEECGVSARNVPPEPRHPEPNSDT